MLPRPTMPRRTFFMEVGGATIAAENFRRQPLSRRRHQIPPGSRGAGSLTTDRPRPMPPRSAIAPASLRRFDSRMARAVFLFAAVSLFAGVTSAQTASPVQQLVNRATEVTLELHRPQK